MRTAGWMRRGILAGALCLAAIGAPAAVPAPNGHRPIHPKVFLLIFDPPVPSEGGNRLHQVCGWNDPQALTQACLADLRECSGGYVQYEIVETQVVDELPRKRDGFAYTVDGYLQCWRERRGWHHPDMVDYPALARRFDLMRRINRREADEIWIWGPPYSGLYESTMAGKDAYFCNSAPLTQIETSRPFILMGFNYERGVGEMLEDMGHRAESIMRHVYGSWEPRETHAWNRFTLYDRVAPGRAGVGTIHFAPNSTRDYDWGNKRPVVSSADDWLNYPHLTGKKRMMTCADWGGGDLRLHHKWWLAHLPKAAGRARDGKLANWWKYVIEFGRYEESR